MVPKIKSIAQKKTPINLIVIQRTIRNPES